MAVLQFGRGLRRSGAMALALCMVAFAAGPVLAGPTGAIGDVYVGGELADGTTGIFQYDGVSGASAGVFTPYGGAGIGGMAWGPDANLYAVSVINFSRWNITKIDGNTGAKLGNVLSFNNPSGASVAKGIAFGPDGDMYVGDWWNARIDRYKAGSFGLKASYQGVAGDGLGTPNYMTFAPNGHLMVVSGGYNSVLQFDTSANGLSLLGTFASFSASQAQDLAFGPNGNLFVSGGYSGGVMEFDGTTGAFVRDFVAPDSNWGALGLRFDSHGRLLVSTIDYVNQLNNRVVAYDATSGNMLGDFFPAGSGGNISPIYMTIKTPEPATIGLLIVGGLALSRRRR